VLAGSSRPKGRAALLASAAALLAITSVTGGGVSAAKTRAPKCPWMNTALSPDKRARKLVSAMTIDQKIAMLSQAKSVWVHYGAAGYVPGQRSLCIPDLVLSDAGQGVGDRETKTTAFPAPISQASSWDTALQRRFGSALGWEAWHKGIDAQLAPGIEIDRVPLNGRNFEYMSEDPYLAGQGAAAEVQGIQSNPVIATVKHYLTNSQETNRHRVSSDVDQRTLHEIYAVPYEAAVREGHTGAVMCSYNRINGIYACQNPDTLTTILRHQLGFDGFVVSDWGATASTVAAVSAGLDMEMAVTPGYFLAGPLKAAVRAGQIPMSRLNDMVLRIVRSMFRVGIFDHPPAAEPAASAADVRRPQDIALARTISEEGTVLLKNSGKLLPLAGRRQTIAVIGPGAGQPGAEQFYNGGGSGHIPEFGEQPGVVSPLRGITTRARARGDRVLYADGSVRADTVAVASAAKLAIVFVGARDTEATDRSTLDLSTGNCMFFDCTPSPVNQDALISQVAAANRHTIVVLNTGGPVVMPWLHHVKGLLEAWYPGQQDGNAIAALLFGDVDPSAKLPETFPASEKDLPTQTPLQYPGVIGSDGFPHAVYSERLLVGYRWYDAKNISPLFPFGFGLSYTTFGLRGLRVARVQNPGSGVTVSFEVLNTGSRVGAEVAQLYVADPRRTGEPPKQLKGFTKVFLKARRQMLVTLALDYRSFAYWNTSANGWRVMAGCYGLMIGRSSRDLPLRATVAVGQARCPGATTRLPLVKPWK
jgi:beta-glucosidase